MVVAVVNDRRHLARALALAARGEGLVEPNPMVGCVIVRDDTVVAEGWHPRFGGPHAEIVALQQANQRARGATLYCTLEPCCHHGKTPPCTDAIIRAGIDRVVFALRDPSTQVNGGGEAQLREAGIHVDSGLLEYESRALLAPYLKLLNTARPWVIAKWAMTLDGRIATHSGDSKWISGDKAREIVHQLRGRVDAIVVGAGTASVDDPLLTARPANPEDVRRTATRIVVDDSCMLPPVSQLVRTAGEVPLLVATSQSATADRTARLADAGAEIFLCEGGSRDQRLASLLEELGRRRMTNLLAEGGGRVLGELFDLGEIDEVHAFIAPKLVGGPSAMSPFMGRGVQKIDEASRLTPVTIETIDEDVYIHGRVTRLEPSEYP